MVGQQSDLRITTCEGASLFFRESGLRYEFGSVATEQPMRKRNATSQPCVAACVSAASLVEKSRDRCRVHGEVE